MNNSNRRRYPRYETKVDVTISSMGSEVKGTMTDISQGGIGVISPKTIKPGTEVHILLKLKGSYTIQGAIAWSLIIYENQASYYRMGIESDRIVTENIIADEFPGKDALMTHILP